MATPRYMAATTSSAAKCRNKTPVNKSKLGDHQWNASPKIKNPDGPIKPLPPMINYRAKMDAPRKKRFELLAKIKANKQEALRLSKTLEVIIPSQEKFTEEVDGLEHKDGVGWVRKDNDIYSSLPPMGNEEEYERKYRVDEDIVFGEGKNGLVVKGWRRSDNKEVAIKIVERSGVYNWGNVNGRLYPTEYCHLRMVDGCKRIANLLDGFEIGDDEFILALETLSFFWDLYAHVQHSIILVDKNLEESHCKMIFRQLVEAVEHCHNSGIFHRDIKLDNILIDCDTHEVKLIDFDLSAPVSYSPFEDKSSTPGYMSPEMYDDSAKYEGSPAAVYSMGVVLYDIVFGAYQWKLFDSRRPMPKVSYDCLDLICKMTATRPEDRLPFDKILDHPWMQSNKKTCADVDEKDTEKKLTDVPNQHVRPVSTHLFSQTDKETNNISFVSSLENGDKLIGSVESIAKDEEMKKVKVPNQHVHSDSSRNLQQFIQPIQSDLSLCPDDEQESQKKPTDVPNQHVQPASILFSHTNKETNSISFVSSSLENGDKPIGSVESIAKDEEMKKVKVPNQHVHSDSSRNLQQFIQPIQSDSSPCFFDEIEAEEELTDVPN